MIEVEDNLAIGGLYFLPHTLVRLIPMVLSDSIPVRQADVTVGVA